MKKMKSGKAVGIDDILLKAMEMCRREGSGLFNQIV